MGRMLPHCIHPLLCELLSVLPTGPLPSEAGVGSCAHDSALTHEAAGPLVGPWLLAGLIFSLPASHPQLFTCSQSKQTGSSRAAVLSSPLCRVVSLALCAFCPATSWSSLPSQPNSSPGP